MKRSPFINPLQAVIAAPTFCVGVCCSEVALLEIRYLEPQAESPPENALAAEAVRQIRAYLADPAQDGHLTLTFEIVYGHAFKPARRVPVAEHSAVSLQDMRAMLRGAGRKGETS